MVFKYNIPLTSHVSVVVSDSFGFNSEYCKSGIMNNHTGRISGGKTSRIFCDDKGNRYIRRMNHTVYLPHPSFVRIRDHKEDE